MVVVGLARTVARRPAVASSAEFAVQAESLTQAAVILLVLRAFSSGCSALTGRRGGLQRRARVPQAQGAQRADDARPHGRDRDRAVLRTDDPRAHLGRPLRREPLPPRRLRLREPAAAEPDGAGGLGDVRHGIDPVLHHPGRDRLRPAPRRQHGLQRLPPARLGARTRRLRAQGAQHPRRSPGVLQRHDHPGHRRDRRARDLPGEPDDAHPAVHHRRVRLVLARPDRHGAALAAIAAQSQSAAGGGRGPAVRRVRTALRPHRPGRSTRSARA